MREGVNSKPRWPAHQVRESFPFTDKKKAGEKPAFLVRFPSRNPKLSFTAYGLLNRYGLLGAAGVVVDGVGLVPKSTLGGASVPGAASKYVRGLAPVTFAVIACGKVRM
jgi:hypothetical protein